MESMPPNDSNNANSSGGYSNSNIMSRDYAVERDSTFGHSLRRSSEVLSSGNVPSLHVDRPRYDVAFAMERLRTSMVGNASPLIDFVSNNGMVYSHSDNSLSSFVDMEGDAVEREWLIPHDTSPAKYLVSSITKILQQVPAVLLIGMFHLMIGIPFGVSYFPIGWGDETDPAAATPPDIVNQNVHGPFPLPGKEALGIRMFLFSTIAGQLIFTFMSGFANPIGLQMVENVPFCHALSAVVIRYQGYGSDALATLLFLFGLSSVIVGIVFYLLGKLELGRIVYFFPTHVLVGCIGGIGVFIAKTGVEVTINATIEHIGVKLYLFAAVLVFEITLRSLEWLLRDEQGKPRYTLLSPLYFCAITPVFYIGLLIFGDGMNEAMDAGYFFPPLDACEEARGVCDEPDSAWATIFSSQLWDMWHIVHLDAISWQAVQAAVPTLIALTLFSLIHVPINIPAFAISTNTEADMNKELVAHGFSNLTAGVLGGLQNYMAYTQSVLYYKSGGKGQASGIAVAAMTLCLFFIGPAIASYIPRCMAGTLLLHVGIDLFLEDDSYGKFDNLEYGGIWLIVIVMTMYGMDAAMIAGVVSAVTTFVVQNVTYLEPVRGHMSAATLRSSRWNRSNDEIAILNDDVMGRRRICVMQLQGHLFFGNMAKLSESVDHILSRKTDVHSGPWIVIVDFSLVLGIDSSAAQALCKMRKNLLERKHAVDLSIFVTGSEMGFPTDYPLYDELTIKGGRRAKPGGSSHGLSETSALLDATYQSSGPSFFGSYVCESLDLALMFAEDALIARQDEKLLHVSPTDDLSYHSNVTADTETTRALGYLKTLCPSNFSTDDCLTLLSYMVREEYGSGHVIWKQGASGDSAKLLVTGALLATLENEAGTQEAVGTGNMIGELGLVQNVARISSLRVTSETAVLYSLDRDSFESLIATNPRLARCIDLICVKYLAARVQHVSNRIVETRCLPI